MHHAPNALPISSFHKSACKFAANIPAQRNACPYVLKYARRLPVELASLDVDAVLSDGHAQIFHGQNCPATR
jgi:hypothetical protein